ncbi:MAG: (2Fe-2S)-binding protein [Rhodobacter sp.]|nr:(2Fe-2S)-binding protein [Rhodobacter sp.]
MTGRLATGGRIERTRRLNFTFNGQRYCGFQGDTLASALLANGVTPSARSFKYHRPRGIVGAGVEEPATIVELLGEDASGNQPATTVPLRDGLAAKSVNCWPSPRFDLGAVAQIFARLIPAGFYYKTFKWPSWRLFEPAIRRAAGLAAAPHRPPTGGHFESRNAHADILIAGAGPAGLMAALIAGRSGARVFLADEGTEPGGSLLSRNLTIDGRPAMQWVAETVAALAAMPNVTHLQNSTVWAYREHNLLCVNERDPAQPRVLERNWRVRARRVVIATGAIERMLVFANNDRPGVMLASAIQTYVNRYAVRPGKRAVFFTCNDSAYAAAADFAAAGGDVAAIIDSRAAIPQTALDLVPGLAVLPATVLRRVIGRGRISAVQTAPAGGGTGQTIACDLLGCSGGWSPTIHLFSQSRGTLKFDQPLAAFLPDAPAQPCLCAGAAAGAMALPDTLKDTAAKARASLEPLGFDIAPGAGLPASDTPYSIEPLWRVENAAGAMAFLDIQNDVTVADVHLALREGYGNVEHVKRYTTGGMGIDQGKTGNINIIGTVALQQGTALPDIGTTTFRAPYTPVSFGAISGLREGSVVLPYRHTPVTGWNVERGAVMYEAGARWRRPGYFPRPGEGFQDAVNRECRAVRNRVGVYDGAPLGKFELKGRDTGQFLDLIFTNVMSTLSPGACRYGLVLSDDGLIMDDGVVLRLDDHRWLVSTSTGHADAMNQHMEKVLQFDHPGWQVMITPVTSQWNNATICGPDARKLLAALGTDIDLSPGAFPFMSFREGIVADLPARVVRVSFTGELSFEINVAPRHMLSLWQKVMATGAGFGIEPVGSEASHVLRVEKGFLSLGHEVDGTVDPIDLGMGWVMSGTKPDFIGKRSVALRRAGGAVRRELVGLLPDDPATMIPEGAPLTPGGRKQATEGLVTACVYSTVCNRWVALGLLENGRARLGRSAHARLRDRVIPAQVTAPVFHDPAGERLRA